MSDLLAFQLESWFISDLVDSSVRMNCSLYLVSLHSTLVWTAHFVHYESEDIQVFDRSSERNGKNTDLSKLLVYRKTLSETGLKNLM